MEDKHIGLDLRTPLNATLTPFFTRSFAFVTVKSRLPGILTQTIDILNRKKEENLKGLCDEAETEYTAMVNEISKLKAEIQNNKPISKLTGYSGDIAFYNKALELEGVNLSTPTYFNTSWLFVECYMYRRVIWAIQNTKFFKDIDPFQVQKEDSFYRSIQAMGALASHILNDDDEDQEAQFLYLLKINLWGNKCDLSLFMGRLKCDTQQLLDVEQFDSNILCNDSLFIWDALTKETPSQTIDIILDNTAYELFTDMCLADFIVRNKYAEQIRFHVKVIPWFISDVTTKDFNWIMHQLKTSKNSSLKKIGERFSNYMRIRAWTIEEHVFWTTPFLYKDMEEYDWFLYRRLSDAKLIIFKGDVNYRKLFGERNWPATTPIATALQGFHPSKLCVIRTIKAEIVCDLPPGVEDAMENSDKNWLLNGNYGVIQYCDKIGEK